jgi:hypothetical protein
MAGDIGHRRRAEDALAREASGAGRRGDLRICYLVIPEHRHLYFMTMYAKNEARDLTAAQRREIAMVVREIKAIYGRGN